MRFLLSAFLLVGAASLALADELKTLAGKSLTGNVSSISGSELVFKTEKETVVTPLSQVLALDLRAVKGMVGKHSAVRLIDDTVLQCTSATLKKGEVELKLSSGASIKLPMNVVVWLMHDAQSETLRKRFDQELARKVKKDRIFILRDDDLNPIEGTLGEVDAKGETIQFKPDGGDNINVPLDRVHAVSFYRSDAPSVEPICKVIDIQGNQLFAKAVGFSGKDYEVTTTFGAKISLPGEVVAKLDFNMGKLTYLSDIEPMKVYYRTWSPFNQYRKDTNLDKETIVLEKQHAKGITLNAHTELDYQLNGKFKEFKATLGVPRGTESQSLVRASVSIYCDGEKKFSEVVTAKTVRPISVNVKDVNVLRIVVSGPNEIESYHNVTLADARVSQ